MNVVFTPTAWEQYTDWQKEDKKMNCNTRITFVKQESHFVMENPTL